jgi:hypothetical protein
MDETVFLAVAAGNEAEPFRVVEPLYGAGCTHCLNFSLR